MAKQKQVQNVRGMDFVPGHDLEGRISPRETPADRKARIDREAADAGHARRKDLATHAVFLLCVVVGLGYGLYLAVDRTGSSEDRKWGQSVLFSIISAGVAYVAGRNQAR